MVNLQSIYTETMSSKDPWYCLFFLIVMMILNYSGGTTERSGFPQSKSAELEVIRSVIVLILNIASAIRWILSAQNPFTN